MTGDNIILMSLFWRVAELNDIESIAKETNCVKSFIARGISLASFTHARCLDLGKGTKQDSELAKNYYRRVSWLLKKTY